MKEFTNTFPHLKVQAKKYENGDACVNHTTQTY